MATENSSRRTFLQQIGLGSSLLLAPSPNTHSSSNFSPDFYPTLDSFQNENGDYLVRVGVRFKELVPNGISAEVQVRNGNIRRAKSYFMPIDEWEFHPNHLSWQMPGLTAYPYTIVCWITPDEVVPELSIQIDRETSLSLAELFDQRGLEYSTDTLDVSVGLLGSQEVGTVGQPFFSVSSDGNKFQFAVMADPQGGDAQDMTNGSITRMKIHNAFVENSVSLVSLLEDPAFCLVLGDIVDSQGQETNFEQMFTYFKKADISWLYSVGNHETKYRLTFGADYEFSGFSNYLTAQKKINGMEKLLYSFDLGQWHFIVWPDPLRKNFWETHPHYFDWLEQDLEQHQDQPTFFLQHIPVHPIGIDPLVSYVESVVVKRTLLDILAKYGNVKYVLSGHVHIPLIASRKTAVTYEGMNLINLPAAGFRPRGFGEEDITGGPVQGVAVANVDGKEAQLAFHTVTDEIYEYPTSFREFSPEEYPLWLKHKWELEASEKIQNSNFSEGLKNWHRRFVYEEDENPSNICEARSWQNQSALYLYSASRGYRVPGQDRLPQTINRICQAISLSIGQNPILSFQYQVDDESSNPDKWVGSFIWIEGFEKDLKKLNQVYAIGKAYGNLRDNHRGLNPPATSYFHLPITSQAKSVQLDIARHHEENQTSSFSSLSLDRLVINLGIWTANEKPDQRMGVYFTNFRLDENDNGSSTTALNPENIWRKGIDHIAGEHINVKERYVPPERS
ncbi:MAG: metallophosphoesterase [Bacteroidota bacterium]